MSGVEWNKVEWFLEDWRYQSGVSFWFVDENSHMLAKSTFPALCEQFCGRWKSGCPTHCPYGLQQLCFPARADLHIGTAILHMGGFYETRVQQETCLDGLKDACAADEQAGWAQAVRAIPILSLEKRDALAAAANSFARLMLDWRTEMRGVDDVRLQRDGLTGLHNRAAWEGQLLEIEQRQLLPLTIIVADIDELKFVNETLGVEVGNRVLERAAALLKKAFCQQGFLARIGGDSFGAVCTGLSLAESDELLRQLREAVEKPYDNNMSIGMSFGMAFGGSLPLAVRELRCQAENAAISEKQLTQRISRHNVVRQVVERLRTFESAGEGRPDELQRLALAVGNSLRLPDDRIRKLVLLMQYHAIGKAVFDNALVYHAATQTEREKSLEQQHASVGYRLALTLPDAAPVAELILKQYESWDGNGYPLGLTGAEIPIECRILAVVMQYDRLRRQRLMQKAPNLEETLSALRLLSGHELDPQIVDVFFDVLTTKHPISSVMRER